ncbi:MAG: hypothetical protein ABEK03_05085 [Candidatus Bipolaricaulia bacterium]
MRKRCTLSAVIGLMVVPLLIAGCTFWIQTSDGRVRSVNVPDDHVERFVNRMDQLSADLLQETERIGDYRLRQAAVELRWTYTQAVEGIGQGTPANPVDLENIEAKLDAFERQLDQRLSSGAERQRYRTVLWYFQEIERAYQEFRDAVL